MSKTISIIFVSVLVLLVVQYSLQAIATSTKDKESSTRVTGGIAKKNASISDGDTKVVRLSPALIGTPAHLSLVVGLTRPVERLSDIRLNTTCGCVKARAELVPNDKNKIRLSFDYEAQPPESDAVDRISVVSNDSESLIMGKILIEAQRRYPLSIHPRAIDLGRVIVGQQPTTTVVTVHSYTKMAAPKSIASSPDWIVGKLIKHTAKESQFSFALSSHATPGPLTGTIVFKADKPKNNPSANIEGYIEGDVIAEPSEIQFPTISQAQISVPVEVVLSSCTALKSLPGLIAKSQSPIVSVQTKKQTSGSTTFEFVLDRQKARPGVNKGCVTLTNTKGDRVLNIPYRFIKLN